MEVDGQPEADRPATVDKEEAPEAPEAPESEDATADMETSSEGGASTSTLVPSSSSTGGASSQALVSSSGKTEMKFKLLSPVGGKHIEFTLVKGEANRDVVDELCMHLTNIFKLGFGIKEAFEKTMNGEWSDLPWTDAEKCVAMILRLNKCIGSVVNLWRGATRPQTVSEWFQSPTCNAFQAKKLSFAIFNRVVKNAQVLNKCYKSFSSLTYGETSFDQVQIILDRLNLTDKDVFVDLGSGVGHVVTYAAAYSKAKRCVGIEINKLPAMMAENMKREFINMMSWYGKKFRPFELLEGDFLDPTHRNLITKEATVIFINNFAFEPSLMFNLREIIMELEDNVKIVCTKSFSEEREEKARVGNGGEVGEELVVGATRKNRPPTNRTICRQTIDQMLDCEELPLADAPVSWSTGKGVQFLLFTVNRSKIEKMFESANSSSTSRSGSAEALANPAAAVDDASKSVDASIAASIDAVVKARVFPAHGGGGTAARRDTNVRLYDDNDSDDDDDEYAPNARKFPASADKKRKGRDDDTYVPKKRSSTGASTSRSHKKQDVKKEKISRRPPPAIVAAADNATPMHPVIKDSKVKKEELRPRVDASASSSSSDARVFLDPSNPIDRHLSKSRGRPRKSDGETPVSSKRRRRSDDSEEDEEEEDTEDYDDADDSSTKENGGPPAKKHRALSTSSSTAAAASTPRALSKTPKPEPTPKTLELGFDGVVKLGDKPAVALHSDNYDKAEVPEWVGKVGKCGAGAYVGIYAPHHSIFEGDPTDVPEKRTRKSIQRFGNS